MEDSPAVSRRGYGKGAVIALATQTPRPIPS